MISKNFKRAISFFIIATSANLCFAKAIETSSEKSFKKQDKMDQGVGSFIYQDYKPLANKTVKVRYYNPGKSTAQVLFVMHGNSRAAEGYFNAMLKYAEKYGVLLVVPEFDAKQFPSRDYHRGGILDKQNNPQN